MFSVYKEPVVYEKVLTSELCDTILKTTSTMEKSSFNINYEKVIETNIRNSNSGCIKDINLTNMVFNICEKLIKHKFIPEGLNVVHYETGGFYKRHYDSNEHILRRDFTFIIALNDGYEGGETYFPLLDQSFKLKKGDVLFFHNRNTDGTLAKLSLHEGKTVKSGEKWICNVWVKKLL